MSTKHFKGLNTVKLRIHEAEARKMLWRKAQAAWMHVYYNYIDKADWFMRADDDSTVMMDNLREFLEGYDTDEPHWLGRPLYQSGNKRRAFFSGGAANIMSREALRRLGKAVIRDPDIFDSSDTYADDLEISLTLRRVSPLAAHTPAMSLRTWRLRPS